MTFAIRLCVRCAEEELPWYSWAPHALEELARDIGVGPAPESVLDAIRNRLDGKHDPRAEQLRPDQVDVLSLCVASHSENLARVANVADLLSADRCTNAARASAAVAYTVARSYALEGAWGHAAWWSEFAAGDEEFGAYAELVKAIARIGVDVAEARVSCQHAIAHWPPGTPCTGAILLEGALAESSTSPETPRFREALDDHLALISETMPDPEPAFAKATAGVTLLALGQPEAKIYIEQSLAESTEAVLRLRKLLGWLVRELVPGAHDPIRQQILAELSRLGPTPPDDGLG